MAALVYAGGTGYYAETSCYCPGHEMLLMHYERVCLESFGYCLPTEIWTSDELERRLEPLYRRLRLPEGRLELITGITERRVWPAAMLPSQKSISSGQLALTAAQWDPRDVGALIHASVCRDHLEPATACRVHHGLGLPADCLIYDVSNACLGLMNGVLQVANMIELGQIRAGLVVGTEDSRYLLDTTIAALNADQSLTRQSIKRAVASLTIGSASCAILLVNREQSRTGNRLLSACATANTKHHQLCHSGRDEAIGSGMSPLMETDSETLMRQGIATGATTFERFLEQTGWDRTQIDRTFCHQVGLAHRKAMLEALNVDIQRDFSTVRWLGNTGSVALPVTMAIGCQTGFVQPQDQIAMLGIGSGINCLMIGVQWQESRVETEASTELPAELAELLPS